MGWKKEGPRRAGQIRKCFREFGKEGVTYLGLGLRFGVGGDVFGVEFLGELHPEFEAPLRFFLDVVLDRLCNASEVSVAQGVKEVHHQ